MADHEYGVKLSFALDLTRLDVAHMLTGQNGLVGTASSLRHFPIPSLYRGDVRSAPVVLRAIR